MHDMIGYHNSKLASWTESECLRSFKFMTVCNVPLVYDVYRG